MKPVRVALAAMLLLGGSPALAEMLPAVNANNRDALFASMSPSGVATMMAAMRDPDTKAMREQIKAARDRMLTILDGERLDPVALRQAMEDEQQAVNAQRNKRQSAMMAAFQLLSLADRRAFVADARSLRERVAARTGIEQQRRIGAATGLMPNVPPPR